LLSCALRRTLASVHGWNKCFADLRLRPLEARREAPKRPAPAASCSEALAEGGAVVFDKACQLGLEGIVSKRAGSLYKSGPTGDPYRYIMVERFAAETGEVKDTAHAKRIVRSLYGSDERNLSDRCCHPH
jgi:hypothetical protein